MIILFFVFLFINELAFTLIGWLIVESYVIETNIGCFCYVYWCVYNVHEAQWRTERERVNLQGKERREKSQVMYRRKGKEGEPKEKEDRRGGL